MWDTEAVLLSPLTFRPRDAAYYEFPSNRA